MAFAQAPGGSWCHESNLSLGEFMKSLSFGLFSFFVLTASTLAAPVLQMRAENEQIGGQKPVSMMAVPRAAILAVSATSPIDCYNQTGNINTLDSVILCAGASSRAPVDCYNQTGNINTHDSAILCSGATSSAPIDCYNHTGSIDAHNSAILCSGAQSNEPVDCYNNTGSLDTHTSAILCSRAGARFAE